MKNIESIKIFFENQDFANHGRTDTENIYKKVIELVPELDMNPTPKTWIDFCAHVYQKISNNQLSGLSGDVATCKNLSAKKIIEAINSYKSKETSVDGSTIEVPKGEQIKEYKVYNVPLHESKEITDFNQVLLRSKSGKLEYGSGLTLNFGEGVIKKFGFSLESPCNWENREEVLSVMKKYCDSMTREEFKYINNKKNNIKEVFDFDVEFGKIYFKELSSRQSFCLKYESQKTIPIDTYENSRFYLKIECYFQAEDLSNFRYEIVNWVNEKLELFEKENQPKIEAYRNQKLKNKISNK